MNPDQVEFERQFSHYDFSKNSYGGYINNETSRMFSVWNAALMYECDMMVQGYATIGVLGGGVTIASSSQSLGTNASANTIGQSMANTAADTWSDGVQIHTFSAGLGVKASVSSSKATPAKPGINDQVAPELMRKRVSEW